jgi:hypothetical protein
VRMTWRSFVTQMLFGEIQFTDLKNIQGHLQQYRWT